MSSTADSLIELAKWAASRHDERRRYEWKVSFAFWGLIIAAIAKKSILSGIRPWWVWVPAISLLYAFVWLRKMWVSSDNDKSMMMHFVKQACMTLQNPQYQLTPYPDKISKCTLRFWFGFLGDGVMIFQTLVTMALASIFFLIDVQSLDKFIHLGD